MAVRHMNKKCGSANTTTKNAIEMPARQMNATEYDRAKNERNFGLTARHISKIYHSLIARVLTRQFHVDRAPL